MTITMLKRIGPRAPGTHGPFIQPGTLWGHGGPLAVPVPWVPADLPDLAGLWEADDAENMWEEGTPGTTPAVVDGPVGYWAGQVDAERWATPTTTKKPTLREVGGIRFVEWDGVDDDLTGIGGSNAPTNPATTLFFLTRRASANQYWTGTANALQTFRIDGSTVGVYSPGIGPTTPFLNDVQGLLIGRFPGGGNPPEVATDLNPYVIAGADTSAPGGDYWFQLGHPTVGPKVELHAMAHQESFITEDDRAKLLDYWTAKYAPG